MTDDSLAVRLGGPGSPEVRMNGRRIVIAMPIARSVQGCTKRAVAGLCILLTQMGAQVSQVDVEGMSRVTMARNQLATLVLSGHEDADAVLWVDDDMRFQPIDGLRMLAQVIHDAETPIVAAIGRKKTRDLSLEYCCELDVQEGGGIPTRAHLVRARRVGFGMVAMSLFALRMCAELARKEGRVVRMNLLDNAVNEGAMLFYELQRDGWMLGEDYSFCEDARRAGLDIYVDSSVQLGHVGAYEWSGRIADHLTEARPDGQQAMES